MRNFNSYESGIQNRKDTDDRMTEWNFEDQINRNIGDNIRCGHRCKIRGCDESSSSNEILFLSYVTA